MGMGKSMVWYALMVSAMMLAPGFLVPAEYARVEDIVFHINSFSDGKAEKRLGFVSAGTDKSASLGIPNGARVASAKMNITGQPYTTGGTDYPENVTIDVGNDGNIEWAYRGKGYGDLGLQNEFTSGGLNTTMMVGSNATNSTYFHLPYGADVLSASCTVRSLGGGGQGIINITGGSSNNNFPFNSGAFRFQFLYLNTELGPSGILDKISFRNPGAPTSAASFTSFKMLLCNTPVTTLSTTVATNYGPNTPVKVIDTPLWQTDAFPDGYNTFDVSNDFYYDNTQNLLIEVSLTAKAGGTVYVANKGAAGNRRLYASGDATAATGSVDTSEADVRLEFLTKTNLTVDFCADSKIDYTNPGDNWNNTDLSFTKAVTDFMASAPINFTDPYGISFVTVPTKIFMEFGGTVIINNLSVTYDLTSIIDGSPTLGNLAEGINAVIPNKYDGKSTNIPVAVYSGRAGKVRLSEVRIDFIPPVHPAIIEFRTPEDTVVLMDENTTGEFCITATDPYDYPMNTSWTVNGKTLLRNSFNFSWYADFDANGTYNVTVSVDNDLQKVATSWQVIVRNVNRKPIIDSSSPEKNYEMDENSSATFEISASDPDNNPFTLTWYADGKRVLSDETIYEYKTTYSSAGKHEIKVTVLDSLAGSTTHSWTVTVKDVNAGPIIADSSPPGDESVMPENSAKKFSVVDLSPDLDKQFITWSLDGNNTGITGRSYNYSADFNSAGSHVVQAEVTDGKLTEKRLWTVTVTDVNRAPRAVIASPAAKAEFMVGTDITFDGSTSSDPDGDSLSMSWSEAGKPLGTGSSLTAKLANGKHIITLSVDDGKKNGIATAQVEIYVRYLDFKGTVTIDVVTPTEGQKLVVRAKLTNRGDGSVDELPVSFSVDGTEVATTTIESIEPDAEYPLEFQWKATKGDHKFEVSVNNQNFSKTVTVTKKPEAPGPAGGGDMTTLLAIAAVAVIAGVAAFAVFGMRKKRASAQPGEEAGYDEQPEEEVPYQPLEEEVPAPKPKTPARSEETQAREALDNAETIIKEAESVGLDTVKARQSFKVARNFYDMGKFQKALQYCKTAEENIG